MSNREILVRFLLPDPNEYRVFPSISAAVRYSKGEWNRVGIHTALKEQRSYLDCRFIYLDENTQVPRSTIFYAEINDELVPVRTDPEMDECLKEILGIFLDFRYECAFAYARVVGEIFRCFEMMKGTETVGLQNAMHDRLKKEKTS